MPKFLSAAHHYYQRLKGAPDDSARTVLLHQEIENRATETEWLEFKAAGKVDLKGKDEDAKKTVEWLKGEWSKYLSAFANGSGGVLVWGIQTDKNKDGVDAASKVNHVREPSAFKAKLDDLWIKANYPPVLGVESLAIIDTLESTGMGFVVSHVPSSPHKPHRAEFAGRNFYMRFGDDCDIPDLHLLRYLFSPEHSPAFVLEIECVLDRGKIEFKARLSNEGTATASEAQAHVGFKPRIVTGGDITSLYMAGAGVWVKLSGYENVWFSAQMPIHPQYQSELFEGHFESNPRVQWAVSFDVTIYARDATPQRGVVDFTQIELSQWTQQRSPKRVRLTPIDEFESS